MGCLGTLCEEVVHQMESSVKRLVYRFVIDGKVYRLYSHQRSVILVKVGIKIGFGKLLGIA